MGRLVLTAKGYSWFQKGHPWIFRDDLERIDAAEPGEVSALERKNGTFLAYGFYSERSKIAFRLISRHKEPIDSAFWKKRVAAAHQYRLGVVEKTNAYRLIYGESDGIPSLIVDRYGDHLVLQTLCQGSERLIPVFQEILEDLFRPASMTLRNDLAVRALEGLPQEKKTLLGKAPGRIQVYEGEVQYWVDVLHGQKTGSYLDQRENRIRAAGLLRGRILDVFSYQGLFALHAARQGSHVLAVDSSAEALDLSRENARLNGLDRLEWCRENAFDFLKREEEHGPRYDGIILDPPAFAKSKENIASASRGYKDLNLRALRLLKPGGILVTSSCSYNLSENRFLEILRECALEAGATLRLLEKRTQARDHPILLSFPESNYLKCIFLQKI